MIKIKNISKTFNKIRVINNISLEIPQRKIFGLLGPNGAGKTTLIRILCGIIQSDEGTIILNDKAIEKAKSEFGYVSQYFGQYEELTVWENILFYAKMYSVNDTSKLHLLLSRYNLEQYKNTRAGELSGGYKRRLALVCALTHNPLILFLDEPTAGIDPVTRKLLWDDFYALAQEEKTLFVTTHYMEEAQRCDELAFLAQGEIVAEGTPKNIKDALGDIRLFSIHLPYTPLTREILQDIEGIILINQFGEELRLMVDKECDILKVQKNLEEKINISTKLIQTEINLEDVFIALTQDKVL
ncbi:MAG: ABC transporter ATP-binding protein [Sulfurimonas sp.]|nr:ABC transporter ATP-binding protein [Sulfurimonas sp.]